MAHQLGPPSDTERSPDPELAAFEAEAARPEHVAWRERLRERAARGEIGRRKAQTITATATVEQDGVTATVEHITTESGHEIRVGHTKVSRPVDDDVIQHVRAVAHAQALRNRSRRGDTPRTVRPRTRRRGSGRPRAAASRSSSRSGDSGSDDSGSSDSAPSRLTIREARQRIVSDFAARYSRATPDDLTALLTGLGWSSTATRVAIEDHLEAGQA
jgi:hypothetical protein